MTTFSKSCGNKICHDGKKWPDDQFYYVEIDLGYVHYLVQNNEYSSIIFHAIYAYTGFSGKPLCDWIYSKP